MAFVDDHRERFGVEPICRVLSEHGIKIAPNSYYAHKKRPASTRKMRDERVLAEIVRVPMARTVDGPVTSWVEVDGDHREPVSRYFVTMRLAKAG